MRDSEFLSIIVPMKDKLFRFAKQYLISEEEAEDAAQEVMVRLWEKRQRITSFQNIEAYSMTMTKNFCLDRLRSKQASNLRLVHSNYEDYQVGISKDLDQKDAVAWVQKLIKALPRQQQMIIHMRDVEQYSLEEIAEVLELSNGAVRVALSRARKTIKEQLLKLHQYGT